MAFLPDAKMGQTLEFSHEIEWNVLFQDLPAHIITFIWNFSRFSTELVLPRTVWISWRMKRVWPQLRKGHGGTGRLNQPGKSRRMDGKYEYIICIRCSHFLCSKKSLLYIVRETLNKVKKTSLYSVVLPVVRVSIIRLRRKLFQEKKNRVCFCPLP